jgi:hypothetical protein
VARASRRGGKRAQVWNLYFLQEAAEHFYNLGAMDEACDTGQLYNLLTNTKESILIGEVFDILNGESSFANHISSNRDLLYSVIKCLCLSFTQGFPLMILLAISS